MVYINSNNRLYYLFQHIQNNLCTVICWLSGTIVGYIQNLENDLQQKEK